MKYEVRDIVILKETNQKTRRLAKKLDNKEYRAF
jgi:hypothetical protein